MIMKRFALACGLLAASITLAAQDWGGHYKMETPDEKVGDLYLIPVSPSEAEFLLIVKSIDGTRMEVLYDTQDGTVSLRDGKFVWHAPESQYNITLNLYPEVEDGVPMEGTISIAEDTGGGEYSYSSLSPDGYYRRDDSVFVTPEGYMYRVGADGSGCMLATGGIYTGKVSLPQSVKGPFGRIYPVKGIEADAFKFSRALTQVELYDESQSIAPGALTYTEIPYFWNELPMPYFAYPDKSKSRFVIPYFQEFESPASERQWIVFKQNLAPAVQSGDTTADESKREGRVDQDFGSTRGIFYTLQAEKDEISKMFRGYDAGEIEVLVADPMFVAHHTFPAFGRWKFPEKEVSAPKAIETAMSRKTGRPVMYSRKAAWLRDGNGELDIVEYEHVNHQAMVSFVWQCRGEIIAHGSLTTEIESEFEDSGVWNVDDEGKYGIPDVVTIAFDGNGAVTIFLAKNSPESINCFALHQNEEEFQFVYLDQWYRYVDIL